MRMKFILILLILSVFSAGKGFTQLIDEEKIFSNAQGIRQANTTFYEIEGYSVFVQIHKSGFDNKSILKLKKKLSLNSPDTTINDSLLPENRLFITKEKKTGKTEQSGIYYLFPMGQNEVKVIGMLTCTQRDEQLERFFVQSLIEEKIPKEVYTSGIIKTIKFADREIVLSPVCSWLSTHNVNCPDLGQMNWAEFRSLDRAKNMIEAQKDIIDHRNIGNLIGSKEVEIIFEGNQNMAIQSIYKIADPKLISGAKNNLVVYFVSAEVRGKFVACVMSYYSDSTNYIILPPLLRQVMSLRK